MKRALTGNNVVADLDGSDTLAYTLYDAACLVAEDRREGALGVEALYGWGRVDVGEIQLLVVVVEGDTHTRAARGW